MLILLFVHLSTIEHVKLFLYDECKKKKGYLKYR